MKNKSIFVTTFIFLALLSLPSWAMTYYVDFTGGNDTNAGTSTSTAWKHAPGDPNATDTPKAVVLTPGDVVQFKGGVNYFGQISLPFSGLPGNPIKYKGDGWGTDKAIINGTKIISLNWQSFGSQEEAQGNPNWQKIFWASFADVVSPFDIFFDGTERIYLSQSPNMSDPFWDDNVAEYQPVTHNNITLTSIKDPVFLNQTVNDYWSGGYIQVWGSPNIVKIQKITSFDPASDTIYFDKLPDNFLYADRDQYYSILNHLHALDKPGEYVIDEIAKKIFYWPAGSINESVLSKTVLAFGIGTNSKSDVIIEGFVLHGFSSDDTAHAIWNNRDWKSSSGVTVKNNEIRWVRTTGGRKGAIEFGGVDGLVIENNSIHDCPRNSGILLYTDNTIVRNNTIRKVGYKGLWYMEKSPGVPGKNIQIVGNRFDECTGTHGNPVSIFNSDNVLFANNKLFGQTETLTFNDNSNFVVYNNLILGGYEGGLEYGSNVIRQNGDPNRDYLIIANNTVLYSETNFGILLLNNATDNKKIIIKNNITDGGDDYFMDMTTSHNIYTGLSFEQKRPTWHLMAGEQIEFDLDKIFVNHGAKDYTLKPLSPAIDAGTGMTSVIPVEVQNLFPDFDFAKDINGVTRGIGGTWDIGAYEYGAVNPSQTIQLVPGWNWVSFNVLPADRSLNTIFGGILGQVEQVRTQTQSAIRMNGQWMGDLQNMDGIQSGMMYKVRVTASCTLTVTGNPIAANSPIQMTAGWNWVAFYPSNPHPINSSLASIASQVQQAKSQTQSAVYQNGAWQGDLTQMESGKGYTILMNGTAALIY